MASCTVCALPASVFCTQDTACLCASCDASIHSANPLSARHERRPLCDLCHRTPATVYCKEDAASLCPGCNEAVHEANPIKHTLTPAAALPCCSCQPNAQPNVLGNGGMEQPQPADSHSACGEKGGLAAHEAVADITQANSSPKTSCFGRVPEMLAVDATVAETAAQPAAPPDAKDALSGFLAKAPSLPKGFDFLELDTSASWLDRLDTGFDFADIFNTGPEEVPTDGLVPTLDNQGSDSAQRLLGDNFGQQVEQQSGVGVDQDLAVPTFSLSLPGELPVPELGHGLKRSAEAESADAAEVLMPSAKQQRMAAEQQQQAAAYTPLTAPVKPEMQSMPTGSMMAPAPFMWHSAPLAPPPPAVPQPPQPPQPQHQPAPTTYHSHTSSSQYAAHQAALAAGGNLTREQRVARYREKRKNRKFEKTIRYASRKAYAEVRPRIKGRFATKEEVIALKAQKQQQEQQQQQQMFQQQLEEDFVVPNFA